MPKSISLIQSTRPAMQAIAASNNNQWRRSIDFSCTAPGLLIDSALLMQAPGPLSKRLQPIPGMDQGRRLVLLLTQLGDFDSMEYAQALVAALHQQRPFETATVWLRNMIDANNNLLYSYCD
jgi:hypothetical protein